MKNDNYSSLIQDKLEGETVNENNKSDWEVLKRLSETGKESLFEDANNDEKKQLLQKPKRKWEDDDFFEHLGNGETAKKKKFLYLKEISRFSQIMKTRTVKVDQFDFA